VGLAVNTHRQNDRSTGPSTSLRAQRSNPTFCLKIKEEVGLPRLRHANACIRTKPARNDGMGLWVNHDASWYKQAVAFLKKSAKKLLKLLHGMFPNPPGSKSFFGSFFTKKEPLT